MTLLALSAYTPAHADDYDTQYGVVPGYASDSVTGVDQEYRIREERRDMQEQIRELKQERDDAEGERP
jgi:hypothetical protein